MKKTATECPRIWAAGVARVRIKSMRREGAGLDLFERGPFIPRDAASERQAPFREPGRRDLD